MKATLSSKGQIVLPAQVRKRLKLGRGEALEIELIEGAVVLRPASRRRRYRTALHPVSGLPVMVAIDAPTRKVSASEIARLNAELL
jgi:AbrB family looped-hinge helix DNA binding protein